MKTETPTEVGLTFLCECKGCRGRIANFYDIWRNDQVVGKTEGFYFSASTRASFKSRITGFRHLDDGSLAVQESQAGDMDNSFRSHRLTVWCRYGHILHRDIDLDKYPTSAKARKAMLALPVTAADTCDCHGCQLDKAGR